MTLHRTALGSVALLLLSNALCTSVCLGGLTYSGSLQYAPPLGTTDGLYVGGPAGQWDSYTITLSWTVTNTDTTYAAYPWKYEYRLQMSGTQYGFSHVIIETSEDLTVDDIVGLTGATLNTLTLQTVQGGNTGMPEDVYGIRFNPLTSGITDLSWSFYSNREPVWGDFYARDGGQQGSFNHLYNYNMDEFGVARGFLDPDGIDTNRDDVDPTTPASNGSVDFHILRPDTKVTPPIPAPGTLLLCAIGTTLVASLRRHRLP